MIEFVRFTHRYGLRSHLQAQGEDHFIARHSGTGYDRGWGDCERSDLRRCGCCSLNPDHRCCQTATQEDGICDECRRWCPRRERR